MIFWKEFSILKERASLLPIIFAPFWTNDRTSTRYTYFSCRELCLAIDFLIDNIYVRFGNSVFRQVIGIPMGTNCAPLLADLFLHTFEDDFMVKTMKHDITKAIQFSNTFRYNDDLFSVNNVIIIGRLQSRRLRASSSHNDPVPIQTACPGQSCCLCLPKGVECI